MQYQDQDAHQSHLIHLLSTHFQDPLQEPVTSPLLIQAYKVNINPEQRRNELSGLIKKSRSLYLPIRMGTEMARVFRMYQSLVEDGCFSFVERVCVDVEGAGDGACQELLDRVFQQTRVYQVAVMDGLSSGNQEDVYYGGGGGGIVLMEVLERAVKSKVNLAGLELVRLAICRQINRLLVSTIAESSILAQLTVLRLSRLFFATNQDFTALFKSLTLFCPRIEDLTVSHIKVLESGDAVVIPDAASISLFQNLHSVVLDAGPSSSSSSSLSILDKVKEIIKRLSEKNKLTLLYIGSFLRVDQECVDLICNVVEKTQLVNFSIPWIRVDETGIDCKTLFNSISRNKRIKSLVVACDDADAHGYGELTNVVRKCRVLQNLQLVRSNRSGCGGIKVEENVQKRNMQDLMHRADCRIQINHVSFETRVPARQVYEILERYAESFEIVEEDLMMDTSVSTSLSASAHNHEFLYYRLRRKVAYQRRWNSVLGQVVRVARLLGLGLYSKGGLPNEVLMMILQSSVPRGMVKYLQSCVDCLAGTLMSRGSIGLIKSAHSLFTINSLLDSVSQTQIYQNSTKTSSSQVHVDSTSSQSTNPWQEYNY